LTSRRTEFRRNDDLDAVSDALVDVLEVIGALEDESRLTLLGLPVARVQEILALAHGQMPSFAQADREVE
jgi:hypothetical protein